MNFLDQPQNVIKQNQYNPTFDTQLKIALLCIFYHSRTPCTDLYFPILLNNCLGSFKMKHHVLANSPVIVFKGNTDARVVDRYQLCFIRFKVSMLVISVNTSLRSSFKFSLALASSHVGIILNFTTKRPTTNKVRQNFNEANHKTTKIKSFKEITGEK